MAKKKKPAPKKKAAKKSVTKKKAAPKASKAKAKPKAAAKKPAAKKPAAKKPAAKKPAAKKPAAAEQPAKQAADPIDAARLSGTQSAQEMNLEGETRTPDDTTLSDWAYDWFLNQGGFDGIPGSTDDPDQQLAIKNAFKDAFIIEMRARLVREPAGDATEGNGAPAAEPPADDSDEVVVDVEDLAEN